MLMHPRKLPLRWFCLALLTPAILPAQTLKTTTVTIKVNDQAGTPIAHAKIRIAPSPDPVPSNLETGERGELALPLMPGGYGVFVEESGFKTNVSHLEVLESKSGQAVPIILQLAPTGSPMVLAASTKDKLRLLAFPYHELVLMLQSDFKALPHITVTVQNAHTNAQEIYSGVRVSDLFITISAQLAPMVIRSFSLSPNSIPLSTPAKSS
jgi:hypothetical protein